MGASAVSDNTNVWGQKRPAKSIKALSLKVFVAKMKVNLRYFHNEKFSCQKLRMLPFKLDAAKLELSNPVIN
jgi:hypothetical protein